MWWVGSSAIFKPGTSFAPGALSGDARIAEGAEVACY